MKIILTKHCLQRREHYDIEDPEVIKNVFTEIVKDIDLESLGNNIYKLFHNYFCCIFRKKCDNYTIITIRGHKKLLNKNDIEKVKLKPANSAFNRTCEGILFKAFGKEYILDEKVIESFYEISSRYPTKQIPRFKSYSKIIMALQEQECQFAKYGFQKPEFECELWKEVNGKIIGIVENNSTQTVSFWWDLTTGRINNDCTNMYDLTPIKKP